MRKHWMAAAVMSALAAVAVAKLPPPTPEQEQVAATKKEQEKANIEKEKALLDKAQDRVAEYYKRTKGSSAPPAQAAGKTEAKNIPNLAVVPAGESGPKGGTKQSAEAHSAPAK